MTIDGIDISKWEGNFDPDKAKNRSIIFEKKPPHLEAAYLPGDLGGWVSNQGLYL